MAKESKQEKYYEKAYNQIWNQYEHIYKGIERTEHKFELLTALSGILMLIFFSIKPYEINPIFLITPVGFTIAIGISIYHLIPRIVTVPWVSEEEIRQHGDKGDLMEFLVKDVFKSVKHSNTYRDMKNRYLMYSINIIAISSLVSVVLFLFIERLPWLGVFILILSVISIAFLNSKANSPIENNTHPNPK